MVQTAMDTAGRIGVGILGLGRSGFTLHAETLAAHPSFRVAAVADPLPERLEEAQQRFGCAAHADPAALLADPGCAVVVVATPSHTHAPLALAAVAAGRHVVVEKPVAQSLEELDAMTGAAAARGVLLAGFQPQRYAADFVAVREVIASGRIGRVVEIRRRSSGYNRRADWQMLRRMGGGELRNNGPHFIDQMLALLGPGEVEVWADLQHTVGAGDAEDHVKLCLRGAGGTVGDIEISRCDAFGAPEWGVLGTAGGISGSARELRLRWFDPAELPPLELDAGAAPGRRYGTGETIPWREETIRPQQGRSAHALFYDGLADTLLRGLPLPIPPADIRRQIAVIERAGGVRP